MAYVCFVDEAGCPGVLRSPISPIQPALVLVGLFVEAAALTHLTREFLKLKRKYFPTNLTSQHLLDDLLVEVKGSDLRSAIRKQGKNAKRQLAFLDETLSLLRKADARLVSVCWTKGPGKPFDGRAIYTKVFELFARHTRHFLLIAMTLEWCWPTTESRGKTRSWLIRFFPTVMHVYCKGYVTSVHVNKRDGFFKVRFMRRVRRLEYVT